MSSFLKISHSQTFFFQHQGIKKEILSKFSNSTSHFVICFWRNHPHLHSLLNFLCYSAYYNLVYKVFTGLIKCVNIIKDFLIPKYCRFFLDLLYNLPLVVSLPACPNALFWGHVFFGSSPVFPTIPLHSLCQPLLLGLVLTCHILLHTMCTLCR